jgi:hypothetical protein
MTGHASSIGHREREVNANGVLSEISFLSCQTSSFTNGVIRGRVFEVFRSFARKQDL